MENESLAYYFIKVLTKEFTLFESDSDKEFDMLTIPEIINDIKFNLNFIWLCENDFKFQEFLRITNVNNKDWNIENDIEDYQDYVDELIELYEFKRNQTGPSIPEKNYLILN